MANSVRSGGGISIKRRKPDQFRKLENLAKVSLVSRVILRLGNFEQKRFNVFFVKIKVRSLAPGFARR